MGLAAIVFNLASPAAHDPRGAIRTLVRSSTGSASLPSLLLEVHARYAWLSTVLLNGVVAFVALLAFRRVVHRTLAPTQVRQAFRAALGLSVVGLLLVLLGSAREDALHRLIFGVTFQSLEAARRFTPEFLSTVLALVSGVNLLAVIGPCGALVACASTVVSRADRHDDLVGVRSRVQGLRETINASAALLVAGILHMGAWLRWPASLMNDKAAREAVEQVALGVTVYWGLTFSLMIVAGYLPAMIQLRERALAWRPPPTNPAADDPDKWLVEQGFKFSLGGQLPQVAVMLGPLLAGPLASLFNAATDWAG